MAEDPRARSTMSTTNKIERVIEKYDLAGLGDELVDRWTRRKEDRDSTRELEKRFNLAVLDAALQREGIVQDRSVTERQLDRYCDDRGTVSSDLRERGVDIDRVAEDFVTYQTVHNYLCLVRGVEYVPNPPSVWQRLATIQKMEAKSDQVMAATLEAIIDSDISEERSPTVDIDVGVVCGICGTRTDIVYFIKKGCTGCGCNPTLSD